MHIVLGWSRHTIGEGRQTEAGPFAFAISSAVLAPALMKSASSSSAATPIISASQRAVIKSCTSCAAGFSMVPGGWFGLSSIFFALNLPVGYFVLLTAEWIDNRRNRPPF